MFVQQGRARQSYLVTGVKKKNGISNAIVFSYPGIFIF